MPDTTRITEQCVIRWGAGVTAETRDALLRKMARIRPTRPHRDRAPNYDRALELAGERGEIALRARQPDLSAPADDKARHIVRIYYRSMGGEILACDSAPLGTAAANALERDMNDDTSWSLGTERYYVGFVGALRSGARLVILPSQVPDPVVVVDPGPPDAPILTLCAPSDGYEPEDSRETAAAEAYAASLIQPRRIFNTYHGEMMAKRTARFQTYHRRSIAV